jgi:hypothetical protein
MRGERALQPLTLAQCDTRCEVAQGEYPQRGIPQGIVWDPQVDPGKRTSAFTSEVV